METEWRQKRSPASFPFVVPRLLGSRDVSSAETRLTSNQR